jgi:murein L,D-transpeptidase YafK
MDLAAGLSKWLVLSAFFSICTLLAAAQPSPPSFIDLQRSLSRPAEALKKKEDTLQKQFKAKGLSWPAKYVYIRSFKYDGQLEVWVKSERKKPFELFKTFKICALAGALGPKRMEGDYQVPEGFYYINEFNPNSDYYLSLGLNYPNQSDRILSDSLRPGGAIYIHGSCVTVGCIPITDQQIDELYILCAYAKAAGEDYIPVHIFPIRYSVKKSADFLANLTRTDAKLKEFAAHLEEVYDHFEITHQLPVIMTNKEGAYVFDGLSKKVPVLPPPPKPKKVPVPHRSRAIAYLPESVQQAPQFAGGGEGFLKYLSQMGKALASSLPEGTKKANVVIEFIVDADGTPVNFKMVKGVSEDFDEELITVLERMPVWQPAMLNDKPVAKLLRQSFLIEP